MVTTKHIRSQVSPRDGRPSDLLDDRPPVGVEKHGVLQPVADELLTGLRPAGGSQTSSESRLSTTGDLDRTPQGSNVTLLHGRGKYTNGFVSATSRFVSHAHKGLCTVTSMTDRARKLATTQPKKASSNRQAKIRATDGLHLGHRVALAMAYQSGKRAGRGYAAVDLLADVNRLAGAPPDEPVLSQQMLSEIMRGKVDRSSFTPHIAAACEVDALWLAEGIGTMEIGGGR